MPLAKSFLSLHTLEHFLRHGRLILVNKDFPDDAQLRQVQADAARGGLWLTVESASIEAVVEGELLPDLPLTVTLIQHQEDLRDVQLPSRTEGMTPGEPIEPARSA